MAANLLPLEKVVLVRLNNWLPKLSHPVRIGEHDQSAFALGLNEGGHWLGSFAVYLVTKRGVSAKLPLQVDCSATSLR